MAVVSSKPLTIGALAREVDVNIDTIRFYEREGLIEDPPRSASGYRYYPSEAVARLKFIKRGKQLGFSLKEIRELLDLRDDPDATCREFKGMAQEKIREVEQRLRDLTRLRDGLTQLAEACPGKGTTDHCPILSALEGERPAL